MRKKVIITGGSGLLATNIALIKQEEWDISLITHNKNVIMENVSVIKTDIEQLNEAKKIFQSISPDLIIHTAGLTSVEACEKNQYKARASNVITSRNIAVLATELGCKLVHISTDHFSKENKNSNEDEISIPKNHYAQTKLEAEFEIQKNNKSAIIARTNFFGWGNSRKKSFTDYILKSLRKKNDLTLFSDVFFNPILIDDLIDCIEKLIEKDAQGIFNIVGDDRISKYDFGMLISKIFDLDSSFVKKGNLTEREDLVTRPLDMSLSNKLLKENIGEMDLTLITALNKLKEQEFQSRDKQLKSTVITSSEIIGYGRQTIDDGDIESIIKTLNSRYLTQGPTIAKFEEEYARYVGAKYAVAVSNLTNGLHIAVVAAKLKEGDNLLTSPNSFAASSNCALYVGANPDFADIDPLTLNIDLNEIEKKLKSKKYKVIVPVHFAGHPCHMKELKRIADNHGAEIIEDAAQALGGEYLTGEKIGCCKYSLITGTSFHPVKSITTGEGGMLTTNDQEIYKQLCRLRSHGMTKGNDPFKNHEYATTDGVINPWYMEMQQVGYNYRITDIQCSLGISQLKKLDYLIKKRREICAYYDENFKDLKNATPLQGETRSVSANHLYVLRIDFAKINISKRELFRLFLDKGIGLHVHHIPIPIHPYYQKELGINPLDYPSAMDYYKHAVTLPVFPSLTTAEMEKVKNTVCELIG